MGITAAFHGLPLVTAKKDIPLIARSNSYLPWLLDKTGFTLDALRLNAGARYIASDAFSTLSKRLEKSWWDAAETVEALSKKVGTLHEIVHRNFAPVQKSIATDMPPADLSADQIDAYALLEAISWTLSKTDGPVSHRARKMLRSAKTEMEKVVIPFVDTVTLGSVLVTGSPFLAATAAVVTDLALCDYYRCDSPALRALRAGRCMVDRLTGRSEEPRAFSAEDKED